MKANRNVSYELAISEQYRATTSDRKTLLDNRNTFAEYEERNTKQLVRQLFLCGFYMTNIKI